MDQDSGWFLEVAVPLGVDGLYTYAMPASWIVENQPPGDLVGCRVRVTFGKRKQYVGLVMEVHNQRRSYPVKEVLELLDPGPVWGKHGHTLWTWMQGYYLCSAGTLMGTALPALMRVGSESVLVAMELNEYELEELGADLHPLSRQLWERLRQGSGSEPGSGESLDGAA